MVDKGVTIILAQTDEAGNVTWKPMASAGETVSSEVYSTGDIMGMKKQL